MIQTFPRNTKRQIRHGRIRSHLFGTAERPRVAVYRSSQHVVVQAIDDTNQRTIAGTSDIGLKNAGTKIERAKQVGERIAERLKEANITTVVFDRAGYQYHGRVKVIADALRAAGITV